MNTLIKFLFILILTNSFSHYTWATSDSTNITPTSSNNIRHPVHFIAMIITPDTFTHATQGKLVGFKLTGYIPGVGPAVPNYYNSPGLTGTSPYVGNIIVPYTGNYRLGGMLYYFKNTGTDYTNVCLTIENKNKTTYPPTNNCRLNFTGGDGARTTVDLGEYLQSPSLPLTAGDQLFVWTWVGQETSTGGLLYLLPGSFITLDSVDF